MTPSFATSPIPHQEWYALTLLGRQVGYSHSAYAPSVWHGEPAWKFEEEFHLSFGPRASFTTTATHYVRSDGSHLESTATRQTSTEHVVAHVLYGARSIAVTATHLPPAGVKQTKAPTVQHVKVPIPAGVTLTPETPEELSPADLQTGRVIRQWTLDTDKMQVLEQTVTVGHRELVALPSRGLIRAWRVRIHSAADPDDYMAWVDSSGETVRVDLPLQGLDVIGVLTSQSAATHTSPSVPVWKVGAEGSLPATPVILHPRDATVLDLTITGAPASLKPPSDGPQTVTDQAPGVLAISVAMPGRPAPDLTALRRTAGSSVPPVLAPPPTGRAALDTAERQEALASSALINPRAPTIVARARELTHYASTARQKVVLLHDWVSSQLEEDPSVAVRRTAVEILNHPRGECRDAATLYTAMARAAGVPTRLCVGMVYSGGKFWGHAWAESWVGEWLPVDPSMEGHFVDATHVKLAQGNDSLTAGGAALIALAAAHPQIRVEWVQPEDGQ